MPEVQSLFSATRDQLKEALGLVGSCIVAQSETKGTNPALSMFLLEGDGDFLWITGSDGLLTHIASIEIPCQPFNFCIPARQMSHLVNLFGGDFDVALVEGRVIFKHGRTKYKIPVVSGSAYPETPAITGKSISIKGSLLKRLMAATDIAKDTKPDGKFLALQGLKLEIKDGQLNLIGCDGRRGAVASTLMEGEFDVIIPGKAVPSFIKFSDGPGDVEIIPMENQICLRGEKGMVISSRLTGKYPNWEMVIPKKNPYRAVVSSTALMLALKRLVATAAERDSLDSPALRSKFIFSEGELQIEARETNKGEGVEYIAAECFGLEGKTISVGVAGKQVADFLEIVKEGDVNIEFGEDVALLFSPKQSLGFVYQYFTMPVRLKW